MANSNSTDAHRPIALSKFLNSNHNEIVWRVKECAHQRRAPLQLATAEFTDGTDGTDIFLKQLHDALRQSERGESLDGHELARSAGKNGADLLHLGVPLANVVHSYGDVCQVITEMAAEDGVGISANAFHTLNRCLDDAIAEAVSEYSRQHERRIHDQGTERLGILAHEMRNLLGLATLSLENIKDEMPALHASLSNATCSRSLAALSDLIDRSLACVRLDSGTEYVERIAVADFLNELAADAMIFAESKEQDFEVDATGVNLVIEADRQVLAAAVRNLLHNAFKFTPRHGQVWLRSRVRGDHICFDVEDQCGGLPPGTIEDLFRPYEQRGSDRSGVGLGLVMCRRAARANRGDVTVRDFPGRGCIFTIELPLGKPS